MERKCCEENNQEGEAHVWHVDGKMSKATAGHDIQQEAQEAEITGLQVWDSNSWP
jgi:hypothetical protein